MAITGFVNRWKGKIFLAVGTLFQAGKSSGNFGANGNISVNLTPVGSTASATASQILMTASIPANALDAAGRGVYVEAWGTFAADANTKSVKLSIGGLSVSTGSSTQSGGGWQLNGMIYKTAANAQAGYLTGDVGGTRATMSQGTDTSVDTSAITINVTCGQASASQSDVICNGLVVQHFN